MKTSNIQNANVDDSPRNTIKGLEPLYLEPQSMLYQLSYIFKSKDFQSENIDILDLI